MNTIETIRGLVRPVTTLLVIVALVIILFTLILKFGTADMAKEVLSSFLILVGTVTGFWFGGRKQNGTY